MLLHRYLGSHAFDTLKDAKLKTARITAFNDPFEFRPLPTGTITADIARDYVRSRLDDPDFLTLAAHSIPGLATARDPTKVIEDTMVPRMLRNPEAFKQTLLRSLEPAADRAVRVTCFSNPAEVTRFEEVLLWSHYAKNHEGFRIGFAFPEETRSPFTISKVHYTERRFEIDFSKGISKDNIAQALVDCARVKGPAWQYEHEYRLLTNPRLCKPGTLANEFFVPFEPTWVKLVDFGVRCPEPEIERLLNLLKSDYPNDVLCRKAVFHASEYTLEYTPV